MHPALARVRSLLMTRACAVALSACVILELLIWTGESRHTPLAGFCCIPLARGTRCYFPPRAALLEIDGALRIVDASSQEASDLRDNPAPGRFLRAELTPFIRRETVGLLAPAVALWRHDIWVFPAGPPLTPAEAAAMRPLMASYLATSGYFRPEEAQRWTSLLIKGDGETRTPLWAGLAHDAVALPFLIAWLWSLYLNWVFNTRQSRRERRRAAAMAAGRCFACGYDVRSVLCAGRSVCPECGEMLVVNGTRPRTPADNR